MAKDARVQMPLWTCCVCDIIIMTYGKFIANEKMENFQQWNQKFNVM
jgi:hypothetical protein